MAMVPLYRLIGKRAGAETRSVTVPAGGAYGLPGGSYGFVEFYCDDRKCDCRRVIFQVWREDTKAKIWATITYGWDTPEYYARWSGCGAGIEAEEMASATLEPLSPQTELSGALLNLFREVLLEDADYVARLKRHYREACPRRSSKVSAVPEVGADAETVSTSWKVRQRMKERRRR
jgi:hypothetical protein